MADERVYRLVMNTNGMGLLQQRIDAIEEVLRGLRYTLTVSQTSFEERFPNTFNDTDVWVDVTAQDFIPRNPLE